MMDAEAIGLRDGMRPVDMFDAAQALKRNGALRNEVQVNGVSGTVSYFTPDGTRVLDIDVARGFVEPYNDRLKDFYEPITYRLVRQ
ncbi:MAG: hypothetical protein WC613_05405 [Candidatus Aenigmatarchaeota archaeon]